MKILFETWFRQQSFYKNLVFIHGDRLFDFDSSVDEYRTLGVQIAWVTWQHLHETLQAVECVCECGECEEQ